MPELGTSAGRDLIEQFATQELSEVAIRETVQALGIQVRAWLHSGECEVRGADELKASNQIPAGTALTDAQSEDAWKTRRCWDTVFALFRPVPPARFEIGWRTI